VPDGHAAAISEALGQRAHVLEIERRRIGTEIEMHVYVDVEFAREFEHAVDLSVRIAVGIRCRADDAAAAPQGLDHQRIGARIVEQPFLRKDADLDVDCPPVFFDQRPDPFETAQADAGIDFELRAHMRGAVQDRFLERAQPHAQPHAQPRA